MSIQTKSRKALQEFIALLQDVDKRWSSDEWNLHSEEDIAASHRALMHIIEAGLVGFFEQDVRRPGFRRIVTPSRKLTGDNSDAIYFDAPVSADYCYVVRGNMNGAVYFSMTIEEGAAEGNMASKTGGVINDTQIDVDDDGSFTVYLGGEARDRNWLPLGKEAARITTRHYFEQMAPAAGNPFLEPRLSIECISAVETPEQLTDQDVAGGIRRVCNFVRSRTLEMPPMANSEPPPFLSLSPNAFPVPQPPGEFGLAAFDAHYSMAPFFLNSDEALVISGRWPECRFANVCLWNRFQQTFDYISHSASFNRVQTKLESDGSFKMIIAHQDPGLPNWLDTQGQMFGLVFWRFFLVEGEVESLEAQVVKFDELGV